MMTLVDSAPPHVSRRVHLAMDESPASVNALKHALGSVLQDGDHLDVICGVVDPAEESAVVKRLKTLITVVREGYREKQLTISLHVAVDSQPAQVIIDQAKKQNATLLLLGLAPQSKYLMPTGILSLPPTAMAMGSISSYVFEHAPPEITLVGVRYVPPKAKGDVDEEIF
ncbi:hypothetical protein DFS34DRAFT_200337 [Phlyctochytrium arcticum]|nr:hypothetical protein DFS34DRAFT_200337 [Phlyctochytrium arcticum]